MADLSSAKYSVSSKEWYEPLTDYAGLRGGSATDAEAWHNGYEIGKTPVETYCGEQGDK